MPSPLKKKTDLKSLSRFSDHFHKWDRHYKEKAWVVKNKVEYYASFWETEKELFFAILAELKKISNEHKIHINLILTYDKFFLSLHENHGSPPWTKTFSEALEIFPDIQCLDIMPNLLSQTDLTDKIWLRSGIGHFTDEANKYIAHLLWNKVLMNRKNPL